jgi:hypothetical protein
VKIIFQTVEDFISLVPNTWDWYSPEIIPHQEEIESLTELYEFYEGKDARAY